MRRKDIFVSVTFTEVMDQSTKYDFNSLFSSSSRIDDHHRMGIRVTFCVPLDWLRNTEQSLNFWKPMIQLINSNQSIKKLRRFYCCQSLHQFLAYSFCCTLIKMYAFSNHTSCFV